MSYSWIDNNLFLCTRCDREMREAKLDDHDAWHEQQDALDSLRSRLALAEEVVEAARRSYPTLISHMIHCEIFGKGDCSCRKTENDHALGKALAAYDAAKGSP